MRRWFRPTTAFLVLLAILLATPVARAHHPDIHQVENGTYRAHPPSAWDGRSELPVLVFFHGFGQSGGLVIGNEALTALADDHGVLVIAPDGREKRWAHQGSPPRQRLRDDDRFVATVLADVKRRWPVDDRRVWASGFSIGGSMTWHLACFSGALFTAYLPVAGAFWRPHPEACPSGPVNLFHTHGTSDTVVPMTGRPIREIYHQGDVVAGIAFWRDQNGCATEPTVVEQVGALRCEIWRGCSSGKRVQLCLHPGGHGMPEGALARALAWAERLAIGD
jgi:polyhydroxybutyrate depolymerase